MNNFDLTLDEYTNQTINDIKNKHINTILHYMINTTRQNIYEPIQLDMLGERLHMSFKRCANTKSYDDINYEHKVIVHQSGGAQDNQFNDLIKFNQPYDNIMVISGKYGVNKMNKYLLDNRLCENNYVVMLDDNITVNDIKFINENIRVKLINKLYNKHYSSNNILLYNIDVSKYIILTKSTTIIEPFYGDGDLLNICGIHPNDNMTIKTFDIIKPTNQSYDFKQIDTLLTYPWLNMRDVFVITNPPYKALNKTINNDYKRVMKQNKLTDLYQIFIYQLITHTVNGGLIIIPINFMFGSQTSDLLTVFLDIYNIKVLNLFETKTFDNTTQSVMSILFVNNIIDTTTEEPLIYLHRKDNIIHISIDEFNNILSFDFHAMYNTEYISMIKHNVNIGDDYHINHTRLQYASIL